MTKEQPHLIAFSGSTRTASLNKKLVHVAAQGARDAGATVTVVDFRDYDMPLYDGDLEEQGHYPQAARTLKELFIEADGFLIASPEYNSGYSAVLKNAIDWLSRPISDDEPMLAAFAGKKASIMATSPGALGGLRGLYQLRELLMNMNVMVHPNMRAVGKGFDVFDDDGNIKDDKESSAVKALGAQTVAMVQGN